MLQHKLNRWQKAGLISSEVANHIAEYERARHSPFFLYSVIGLATLSIGIGIVAIVATNYHKIAYGYKLGIGFFVLLGLAVLLFYASQLQKRMTFEVCLAIFFAALLGMIGLLGQIYNTTSPQYFGLSFWMFISLPIVFYSRSSFFPYLWCVGVGFTMVSIYDHQVFSGFMQERLPMTYYLVIPGFLFLYLGQIVARYPNYKQACQMIGWLMLLSVFSFFFITPWQHLYSLTMTAGDVAIISVVILGYSAFLYFKTPQWSIKKRHSLMKFFIFLYFLVMSTYYLDSQSSWMNAAIFIVLWIFVAHLAALFQMPKVFGLCIFIIGVRLFVIYLEVFGNLLETGIGLMISGFILLLLVWVWLKKRLVIQRWLGGWHD